MKQTAEEYVEKVVNESKQYYKTPQAMIDEQIKLLEGIKTADMSEDEKWCLIIAVSEAYHIVLWNYGREHSQRLVNTIVSFVGGNKP